MQVLEKHFEDQKFEFKGTEEFKTQKTEPEKSKEVSQKEAP